MNMLVSYSYYAKVDNRRGTFIWKDKTRIGGTPAYLYTYLCMYAYLCSWAAYNILSLQYMHEDSKLLPPSACYDKLIETMDA